jgi:hypothetical protein
MKTTLLFVLLSVSFSAFCQENLSIGQDLRDYLGKHPPKYMTAGPTVVSMREGKIDFYKYKLNTTDTDIKILMVNKTYPIGVLERIADKDKILLDMSGSGILDTDFSILFVPYWVVAESTPESLKTKHNNVFKYFEGFYQSFQSDVNPVTSGALKKQLDELVNLMTNDNLENRDLIYALYCYYKLGPSLPRQCMEVLRYLTDNYNARFDAVHPLLLLHTLETSINAGNNDGARVVMQELVRMYPNFVPGLVYQWQLEKDPQAKQRYYSQLKKEHPNHWIVKQI